MRFQSTRESSRELPAARVQVGQGGPEIEFIVTHLDHRSDSALRMKQVAKLRELFFPGSDGKLALLAGDFNATPESPAMKSILFDWADTAAGREFFTIPAGAPRRRIDFILCRPAGRSADLGNTSA